MIVCVNLASGDGALHSQRLAAGVYTLPILMPPDAPSAAEVDAATGKAEFQGSFRCDLEGIDFLHWGEGIILVGR